MIEITEWINCFSQALRLNFEKRIWFVGLQGNYAQWETSDLFQFYYDTKPIKGSLDELLPRIDDFSVNRAIKTGVCNI